MPWARFSRANVYENTVSLKGVLHRQLEGKLHWVVIRSYDADSRCVAVDWFNSKGKWKLGTYM